LKTEKVEKEKVVCSFCNKPGHTRGICRKAKSKTRVVQETITTPSEKEVSVNSFRLKEEDGRGETNNKQSAKSFARLATKESNRSGQAPNTGKMDWVYTLDNSFDTWRIPVTEIAQFEAYRDRGYKGQMSDNWEMVESRPEVAQDYVRQEYDANVKSPYWQYYEKNTYDQRGRGTHDRNRKNREDNSRGVKESHATTPYSFGTRNIVQILDKESNLIGHGTLFGADYVVYLKHYLKTGIPTFVKNKTGVTSTIITAQTENDDPLVDCFIHARLDKKYNCSKLKPKIPMTDCRGSVLGQSDFEAVKVDLADLQEPTYHAKSENTWCGRALLDSEDNTVIGLHAGRFLSEEGGMPTGVCYAVPVTRETMTLYHSFL
jgi:hypothetical protein